MRWLAWLDRKLDEQRWELRLKAVARPEDFQAALARVDALVADLRARYEGTGYDTRHLRRDILRVTTRYYASTGRLPPP